MSLRAMDVWTRAVGEGMHEPTEKRLRVEHGGSVIAETAQGRLVWEPRRIVPSYAVPVADLAGGLVPEPATGADERALRPVLTPGTPFSVHTSPGESLTVRLADGSELPGAAFRPDDPALAGYVVLDFFSFDRWYEEDEPIVGHPRDPFSRIDLRRSSRSVEVAVGGETLASSDRPLLLFETGLPLRFYLPPDDVRLDLLRPTTTRSTCAYKGHASYLSYDGPAGAVEDIAWSYPEPLPDVAPIAGMVAFFDERADVVVDGVLRGRPRTEWSEGPVTGPEQV
jgi:uncharacterized protein (DUF427 family)